MVGRVMRRRQTRRTRPNVRSIEKELSRLSVGAPVKVHCPFEPPSITNSFRVTRRMVFNLYASTTATALTISYPTSSEAGICILPILGKATGKQAAAAEYIAMQFTTVDLVCSLTSSLMRKDYYPSSTNNRGSIFDQFTIDKVSLWGPTLIGLSAVLPIELGGFNFRDTSSVTSENSVVVTDTGDRNHRSHVAITFPKKYWYRATAETSVVSAPVISVQIGTNTLGNFFTTNIKDNDILGVLHVSATGIASVQNVSASYNSKEAFEAEFDVLTEYSDTLSHEPRGEPLSCASRNNSRQINIPRGRREN